MGYEEHGGAIVAEVWFAVDQRSYIILALQIVYT
jgi:hypothetical protein